MWTLKISNQAARFYAKLREKERKRVAAAFDRLQESPYGGKPLKGELRGYWSYRVGVYRILYTVGENEVVVYILRVHHRKEAYERLRR